MEEKVRFVDRVKNTVKEREVKKTLVSHWHENKKFYGGIAVGVGLNAVLYLGKKNGTQNFIFIEGNGNSVEVVKTQKIHWL